MIKTVWLVDTENIGKQWDRLLAQAGNGHLAVLYYTNASPDLPMDVMDRLLKRGVRLEPVRCAMGCPKKNALDFQLCTDLGARCETRPRRKYVILSGDTGYDPVCAYWTRRGRSVSRVPPAPDGAGGHAVPVRGRAMTAEEKAETARRFRSLLERTQSVSRKHHDALCAGLSEALDPQYATPSSRREAMRGCAAADGVPGGAYRAYVNAAGVRDFLRDALG